MPKQLNILHLEDNHYDAELIHDQLSSEGYFFDLQLCQGKDEFLKNLKKTPYDIILSDFDLPDITGRKAIDLRNNLQPHTPLIVVSGAIGEDQATDCLKAGATDYVLKDKLHMLKPAIDRALRELVEINRRLMAEKELHERNSLLSNVIHSTHDAIINLNNYFEILLINPAAEDLFKCKGDQVIGKLVFDLFPSTDCKQLRKLSAEAVAKNKAKSNTPVVIEASRLDDSDFLAEVSCTSFEMDGSEYYTLIARDITEKANYEHELTQERTKLKALIESTKDAVAMFSLDGKLTVMNRSANIYFRWFFKHDLQVGDYIEKYLPMKWRKHFTYYCLEAVKGNSSHVEIHEKVNGKTTYFDIIYNPVYDEKTKEISSISFFARNITPQKLAHEQIQKQLMFLDQASDAIIAFGADFNLTYWNASAEKLFSFNDQTLNDHLHVLNLLQPQNKDVFKTALAQTHKEGNWIGELTIKLSEPNEHIIQSRLSLIKDQFNHSSAYLLICSDFTEKKQIEKQLMRSQRVENIGMLAGGVAHDLNNILSPILLSTQLLQLKLTDQANLSALETIEQSAQRGSEIVKQILSFTKGSDQNKTLVQIRHLTKELKKFIDDTFPKNIELELDVPHDLPFVEADPTELHQVLLNLSVNARDAMPDGGTLKIIAYPQTLDNAFVQMNPYVQEGEHLIIEVSDTGSGIAQKDLEKIFDPFYTTKTADKGTGLGLFTVHNIVNKHQGFISVQSKEGKGTTFKIYFPAMSSQVTADIEEQKDIHSFEGSGETILIIEDEAPIRKIVTQILESMNFKVLGAENGAVGLETFVKHQKDIDLIITDLMMPVMDGPATIIAIHHIDPTAKIITVSGEPTKIAAVKDMDIVGYIQKPFNSEALLKMIAKALAEK